MSNVIVYDKDVPKYELNAEEIVFPLVLDQDGNSVVAFFHMDAQTPAHELKAFLNDMMSKSRAGGSPDETEQVPGDEMECRAFVMKHFRTISGIDGDGIGREEMIAWLDENPPIKSRIFKEGYDGAQLDVDETVRRLTLARVAESSIKTKKVLYSPERKAVEEVKIKYILRKETEEDRIRHKRASKLIEKGKFQLVRFNFDTLEQMFKDLILRIEGALINGAPCTEQNRDEWIPKVNFLDKLFVLQRVFSRMAVKNA